MKLKYYLYHDCVPPIVHRDFKAQNLLLGNSYEPCLAYFGLARLVEEGNTSISANLQFARSYGYFAPDFQWVFLQYQHWYQGKELKFRNLQEHR
ncbi:hypothetical protein P3S67_000924 [Capsicum chacoense]